MDLRFHAFPCRPITNGPFHAAIIHRTRTQSKQEPVSVSQQNQDNRK
jgi:hypothetical protein